MDASEPIPFPEFESLPPLAQARLSGLAQRFKITPRKALMLTILLAQGVPLRDLLDSCRSTGVRITMTDLLAMRAEMSRWVSDDDHRKTMMQRLEEKGLLTPQRREAFALARTRQEMMAVYFDAVPFEVVHAGAEGDFKGDLVFSPLVDQLTWLAVLNTPVKRW